MRIELDEACNCKPPTLDYPCMSEPICVKCGNPIITRRRRKRLEKVRRLSVRSEFQDSRKRAQGGLPVNGVPTSPRSQKG